MSVGPVVDVIVPVYKAEQYLRQCTDSILGQTYKDFELLLMFVRNVNITLYRDRIYETVWETDWMGDTRTLDLHVQRLRRKLDLKGNLKSVYNTGYRLTE